MLKALHSGHAGREAMKKEARYRYRIKKCCANVMAPRLGMASWPCPGKPWSRLHKDLQAQLKVGIS